MGYCNRCDSHNKKLMRNIYGDYICEDCWDDYINSEAGKLEYFVGICRGDYQAAEFDSDFLGTAAVYWYAYRDHLELSDEELNIIETIAENKGLL